MKLKYTAFLLSLIIIGFASCDNDEKNNAPEELNVTYRPQADDQIIAQSVFTIDPPRAVTGKAIIYKNPLIQVLRFEDFMIDNGPKLKVYLSPKIDDISGHINLGDLKAASGSFNYTFPTTTDVSAYGFIMVYSEENNSVYGVAAL